MYLVHSPLHSSAWKMLADTDDYYYYCCCNNILFLGHDDNYMAICFVVIIALSERKMLLNSVQSLSHVRLFATPWTAVHQASLSTTNSRNLLKLISIESVMPSTISSSVIPFSSCIQSLPASGSFPMCQLFTSDGQAFGVQL